MLLSFYGFIRPSHLLAARETGSGENAIKKPHPAGFWGKIASAVLAE